MVEQCDIAHLHAAFDQIEPGTTTTIAFRCDGVIAFDSGDDEFAVNNFRDVTFDGTGRRVRLDGLGQHQLFLVSFRSTLRLRHLEVARGFSDYAPGGGAVANYGSLVADDVTFSGNRAYNFGGAVATRGNGSTSIDRSRFIGNYDTCPAVGRGGGAISHIASGPLTITRSTFTGNRATGLGQGGAVFLYPTSPTAATATISDSHFDHNASDLESFDGFEAPAGGGAIAAYGRPLTVSNTVFDANSATLRGGAILFSRSAFADGTPIGPGGPLSLDRTTFTRNETPGFVSPGGFVGLPGIGGALVTFGDNPVAVSRSTFESNRAGIGGAIFTASPMSFDHSTLRKNSGDIDPSRTQQAGGIDAFGPAATITLTASQLLGNTYGNCLGSFGATFVDGGHNVEQPGDSCGFSQGKR